MSKIQLSYNQKAEKLRSYSSVFSRMSLLPVVDNDDYSLLNVKIQRYDNEKIGKKITTYFDYIKYIYTELSKDYCCEYLYKNTLIDSLLKKYGTKDSIIFNEFRVGNSVADMVMFNGTSKAFEIKTELDSNKRLNSQLSDYSKIFKESYIVTHESLVDKYKTIDESVGVISLRANNGRLILDEIRSATENNSIDIDILMKSIRTNEYKNIVEASFGALPDVSSFDMFETCKSMMKLIPIDELHRLFLSEMKKRKSNISLLKLYQNELKQFCLSTNINKEQYQKLHERLSKPIII